jgi:hypothetical protein
MTWYDGGLRPPRPRELAQGQKMGSFTNGILFIGDEGTIMVSGAGGDPILIPEEKMRAYKKPPQTLPRSPGHYREWIDACKGGKPAGSNFDHAGPLAEAVLLGNIALRRVLRDKQATEKLLWDGPNLRFKNMPDANQFIHKEYREGWTL